MRARVTPRGEQTYLAVRCDGCHAHLARDVEGQPIPIRQDYLSAVLKLEAWASMRPFADTRSIELCPGCYDLELDDAGRPRLVVREHARASVPDAPPARSLS